MSGKTQSRSGLTSEQRKRRTQQIIFSIIAIIVILSWIISLVAH
jgi:predicted nucleic acid-binding Zn ribbon protein